MAGERPVLTSGASSRQPELQMPHTTKPLYSTTSLQGLKSPLSSRKRIPCSARLPDYCTPPESAFRRNVMVISSARPRRGAHTKRSSTVTILTENFQLLLLTCRIQNQVTGDATPVLRLHNLPYHSRLRLHPDVQLKR